LGHTISELPNKAPGGALADWKHETLMLLRKPSDIKQIDTAMKKHFAYYRKHINPGSAAPHAAGAVFEAPDRGMSKYKFVAALREMEKRAVLEGFLFAGTPVVYRGR
jgi:hypothetical protein